MSEQIHYPNAPIAEAVIELRVAAPVTDATRLASLREVLQSDYPECEKLYPKSSRRKNDGQQAKVFPQQQPDGFRFVNREKNKVFLARTNSFTFSVLRSYDRWEIFRDEAQRMWNLYRATHEFDDFTRIALRYLNRIDIPVVDSRLEMTEYFQIGLHLPEILRRHELNGFFLQISTPQSDLECHLVINHTITTPSKPDVVSLVLDIDLFRPIEQDAASRWKAEDAENVWQYLEKLRVRKNEVFESCITDKLRELIK